MTMATATKIQNQVMSGCIRKIEAMSTPAAMMSQSSTARIQSLTPNRRAGCVQRAASWPASWRNFASKSARSFVSSSMCL